MTSVLARTAVAANDHAQPRTSVWGWSVALFGFALASLKMRALESDTFFDLNVGRYIATRGIPRVNDLTATSAGHRWVDQQWLAHWTMYESWRIGGYALIVIGTALALGLATYIFFRTLVEMGISLPRAWLFSLVAIVVQGPVMTARAQALAVPLFALVLMLLMRLTSARSLRPLLWTLPVLCIWANVHGSVVVGALMVMAAAIVLAVRARRLAPALV